MTLVVIDPLVSCAWLDDRSIDCEQWAFSHPEIYNVGIQLIAVFCVSGHWIPVVLTPWGQTVRIASYEDAVLPAALSSCLTRLANALGFVEINFDHFQCTFACKSARGAVAINFLRSQVAGGSRWDYPFSVWEEHHCLRQKFLRSLPAPGEVTRPWIWPSGDNDDHTEREWPSEPSSPPPDHAGARPAPVEAASSSSGQPIEGRSHTCISVADGRFRLLKPWVRMKSSFTCEVLVDQRIHDSTGAFPPICAEL